MKKQFCLLILLNFVFIMSHAQDFVLPLWEKDVPNFRKTDETEQHDTTSSIRIKLVQNPDITVYLPVKRNATGQAVIICPGGGYGLLSYDWEGLDVAKWLNSKGIAGIVLKYRLPNSKSNIEPHKSPLMDAQRAIRLVRHHADEWNIDTAKVGIMGFSAGGHLASTAGTHFDSGNPKAKDPIDQLSCRPDFMVLCYPVISMDLKVTHKGSRYNLIGKEPSIDLVKFYSNELQVSPQTPPTFLIHASDDGGVPVQNSLRFYSALIENGVDTEMHIYPKGGHGFAFGLGKGHLETWNQRLSDWLKYLNK